MSSPDALYYRNRIVFPEKDYKTCSIKVEKSPSMYIEHYDGFGGSYTKEAETKIIKFKHNSKMGNLGYDRLEIIKTQNPSFSCNSDKKVYLKIYKNGKSFFLQKGKNILKQLALGTK